MRSVAGLGLVLFALTGCCSSGSVRTVSATPVCAVAPRAIVFVVNGAGDFRGLTLALETMVRRDCLPLHVHTLEWSHGYSRIFADHLDLCHSRREGRKLAEQIVCYQRDLNTALPLYIVAHSAGSMPALAAAEYLPPNCLERLILLAPSVSADYDLTAALRSTRRGVDVFYSRADRTFLGLGTALLGTADGQRSAPAGRVGFRPPGAASACGGYEKLRQHPWDPSVSWTGYTGGHFSVYEEKFLRTSVAPLLLP